MIASRFAKIQVHEPADELADLATMVCELAEQVAALAREAAPGQADASDKLAAQAALLASRPTAGS